MCAAASFASTASAEPSAREYNLEIASQPIYAALQELSKQTGLNVSLFVKSDEQKSVVIAPVSGRYTLEAALSQMLAPSGLVFTRVNETTIAVTDANKMATNRPQLQRLADRRFVTEQGSGQASAASNVRPVPTDSKIGNFEEVVVTAQRRQENLKDVPISISVMGGAQLDSARAEGITEALNRVPGVATTTAIQSGGTHIGIRGITNGGSMFGGASPVAYYLDAVPFGLVKTPIAPDANAYDLARVEVLRGPQGTLYGANAQNGVVRVLTEDAQLDAFAFKARTSISSTEDGGENYRGDMALNVPLVPGKLAMRAVAGYQESSGWIDRPTGKDVNDAQTTNLRLKINAQPTEEFSIGLSGWISRGDRGAPSVGDENRRNPSVVDESITTDYDAFGAKLEYQFPSFSITSSTGYLDYENSGNLDLSYVGLAVPLFTGLDATVFSEELALSSTAEGPLRWSLGAFYRDAEDRLRQNNLGGGTPFDFSHESLSYAFFGEVGWRFVESWELTLGARYFHDEVTVKENISQGPPGTPPIHVEDTFTSTTPRVVLTWFPSDDVTIYTSYAEGFRSGFAQNPPVIRGNPNFPAAKPDELRNFELGAKMSLADGRAFLSAAAYYVEWDDVPQALNVPYGGTRVTAIVNALSASGPGIELVATVMPVDGMELGATVAWNDLTMDADVVTEANNLLLFRKGDRLNLSAEYTAGAWSNWSFPIGSGGYEGTLALSANYTSEQDRRNVVSSPQGRMVTIAPGDPILVGSVSMSLAAPEHWVATLFIENVTDEDGTVIGEPNYERVPFLDLRVRPRTYGLQLEYRF